jgi:hypothetical protein
MFLAAALASGSSNSTMNDVEPGLLGFLVVAGIGVALVFLLRSMNKQFKKLGPPPDESVETDAGTSDAAGADGTVTGADVGDASTKGAKRR